jgi:hypothetical protein
VLPEAEKTAFDFRQVGTITSPAPNQCLGEFSLQDDGLWASENVIEDYMYNKWPFDATSLDHALPSSVNDARLESSFYSGGPGLFYFPRITPALLMTHTANDTFQANSSFGSGSTTSTQDGLHQDFFESFDSGFNSPGTAISSNGLDANIEHSFEGSGHQSQNVKSSTGHKRPQAKSFVCRFGCETRFSSARDVRRHIITMHRRKAEQSGLALPPPMCPYCCRSYTREDNLTRHLKRSDCGIRQ